MANPFYSLNKYVTPFGSNSAPQEPEYEFYQPQMEQQNRFASLLDNMPVPNKPSMFHNITGALAALNSTNPTETANRIKYAPYYRAMDEFKMMAPFAQQGADNERQANQVGLNSNNQFRSQLFNQRKLDESGRIADAKQVTADENAKTSRLRAEAYSFKQMNPNWLAKEVPGGNIVFFNPMNPSEVYDTGMSSGKMDERDKVNLLQQGRMDVVNTQQAGATTRTGMQQEGANSRTEATIAGANTRNTENIQGRERIAQMSARPGSSSSGSANPSLEQRRALLLRAQQFKLTNPELGKYITLPTTANGELNIAKPTDWRLSKPNDQQYQQIINALGLTGANNQSVVPNNTTPRGTATAAPTASANNSSQTSNARGRATQLLRENNIPITEKNIAEMMRQAGLQ